jgi:hypothetical protein
MKPRIQAANIQTKADTSIQPQQFHTRVQFQQTILKYIHKCLWHIIQLC